MYLHGRSSGSACAAIRRSYEKHAGMRGGGGSPQCAVQACALVWAPRAEEPYPCLDELALEPEAQRSRRGASTTTMELAAEVPWYMMLDADGSARTAKTFRAFRGHTWGYEPPAKTPYVI